MIAAYPLLAVLTWHAVQRSVGAQSYCPEPLSFGDVGNLARPRWESFQRVTVKLYPGHFSSEDQAALREVIQEFETASRTMNCSQVRFVEVKEEAFPIPAPDEGHPGDPADTDTLYILRRPASEMPTSAGSQAGSGTLAFQHYKWERAHIAIREGVHTATASGRDYFKGVFRHEMDTRFGWAIITTRRAE